MSIQNRHQVRIAGEGAVTLVFIHGFGCDQTMWRLLAPVYEQRFRTVTYDLVGCGDRTWRPTTAASTPACTAMRPTCSNCSTPSVTGPVVLVGHSVSATIGMLATIDAPQRFLAQIMVGPSPCYINDGDYVGGFDRNDIDAPDRGHGPELPGLVAAPWRR